MYYILDRNEHGLCMDIEVHSVLVYGPTSICFYRAGRLTWTLCGWSNLGWLFYAERRSFGFAASIEIDILFVEVVNLDVG